MRIYFKISILKAMTCEEPKFIDTGVSAGEIEDVVKSA